MTVEQIEKNLLNVIRQFSSPAVKAVLETESVNSIKTNFETGGRGVWKPSKRVLKEGGQTLVKSGQMSEITAETQTTSDGLLVLLRPGVNAKTYSRIHQEGGTINIKQRSYRFRRNASGRTVFAKRKHKRDVREVTGRAHSITIPPRPYLVIPPEDYPRIINALTGALNLK